MWAIAAKIPMTIVGGVAASLLGRPRLTRDIDALVSLPETRWISTLQSGASFGLLPRVDHPIEFAVKTRVLLLRHEPSAIDVDVMFGVLPFEEIAVAEATSRLVADFEVRLPRIEDLIVMKAIAHRPRDMADIEGLLAANPDVNLAVIRQWVREFSVATTMPHLLEDFENLVANIRRST